MAEYPALHMIIDGEKVSGGGRRTFDVVNPVTGEAIGALPLAEAAEILVLLHPEDTRCPQGTQSFGTVLEVVERAEQERGVVASRRLVEVSDVAEPGIERPMSLRTPHLRGHGVDQRDVISVCGERSRVHTGRATHVDDAGTWCYQASDDGLCPLELEDAGAGAADETISLIELRAVVRLDPRVDVLLCSEVLHLANLRGCRTGWG